MLYFELDLNIGLDEKLLGINLINSVKFLVRRSFFVKLLEKKKLGKQNLVFLCQIDVLIM